jgi:hypothetical protein
MSVRLNKIVGISVFLLMVLALVPVSGWSQEYGAQQQAEQVDVSGGEIESFAKAQNQIVRIQQEYQEMLSGVEEQEARQRMVQEMNEKLVSAVEDAGLSVERYNEIFHASQSDEELQQDISEAMQN